MLDAGEEITLAPVAQLVRQDKVVPKVARVADPGNDVIDMARSAQFPVTVKAVAALDPEQHLSHTFQVAAVGAEHKFRDVAARPDQVLVKRQLLHHAQPCELHEGLYDWEFDRETRNRAWLEADRTILEAVGIEALEELKGSSASRIGKGLLQNPKRAANGPKSSPFAPSNHCLAPSLAFAVLTSDLP